MATEPVRLDLARIEIERSAAKRCWTITARLDVHTFSTEVTDEPNVDTFEAIGEAVAFSLRALTVRSKPR